MVCCFVGFVWVFALWLWGAAIVFCLPYDRLFVLGWVWVVCLGVDMVAVCIILIIDLDCLLGVCGF